MAELYCDHGAYSGTPLNPIAATPTWGQAQEGDGTAPGTATAATASITFSGVPTAGTVSVCGVGVSTTGVIGAASADAAANALATNINAGTSTVSGNGFAGGQQLRNCVYARGPAGGAPAGTCEVMTRAGSAGFNGLTAIATTLDNVGTSSLSWSGGAGGCWGCAWNFLTTTGVSASIAADAYGALKGVVLAGSYADGDTIRFRTDRNVTLDMPVNTAGIRTLGKFGSASLTTAPCVLLFDNGAAWAQPNGVFTLSNTGNKGNISGFTIPADSKVIIRGVARSASSKSFRFLWAVTGSATWGAGARVRIDSASVTFSHVEFNNTSAGTYPLTITPDDNVNYSEGLVFEDCLSVQGSNGGRCALYVSPEEADVAYLRVRFKNTEFTWSGTQDTLVANAAPCGGGFSATVAGHKIVECVGCKWTGLAAGLGHGANFMLGTEGVVESALVDCDLGNIVDLDQGLVGGYSPGVTTAWRYPTTRRFTMTTLDQRQFAYEDLGCAFSWMRDTSLPYIPGTQTWDGTNFSVVLRVASAAGRVAPWAPVAFPPLTKINTAGLGTYVVTVEFLLDQTIVTSKRKRDTYWFEVTYEASDGSPQTDTTYVNGGESLDLAAYVSSAAWDRTDAVVSGVSHYFDKRKLSLTTSKQVKANSPVSVRLFIGTTHPTEFDPLILCPEFSMVAA